MTTITLDGHQFNISELNTHTDTQGFMATNPNTKTLFSSSALLKIFDTPALRPANWTNLSPEERAFVKKQPPLFLLARQGELRFFQTLLAKSKLRLSITASNGANLLHFAASGGHILLAAFFLSQHLPAERTDTAGNNTLDYATRHNQADMAAWLIKNGQLSIKTVNHKQLKHMLWQQEASKAAGADVTENKAMSKTLATAPTHR